MEAAFTVTENQYVDQQTFDAAITRIENALADVLARAKEAEDRSRDALQRTEQEHRERTAEVTRLQTELAMFGQRTDSKLGEIQAMLNGLGGSISRLTGIIETWNEVVKARERSFEETSQRIDKVEASVADISKDVDFLTVAQTGYASELKHLKTLIVGDPTSVDAPPSLFGTVKDIDIRIKQQAQIIQDILNTSKNNSNRIELILLEREQEKRRRAARWQKLKQTVIAGLKAALKNPWLLVLLGSSGTIGLLASVAPQLAPLLEALFDLF